MTMPMVIEPEAGAWVRWSGMPPAVSHALSWVRGDQQRVALALKGHPLFRLPHRGADATGRDSDNFAFFVTQLRCRRAHLRFFLGHFETVLAERQPLIRFVERYGPLIVACGGGFGAAGGAGVQDVAADLAIEIGEAAIAREPGVWSWQPDGRAQPLGAILTDGRRRLDLVLAVQDALAHGDGVAIAGLRDGL